MVSYEGKQKNRAAPCHSAPMSSFDPNVSKRMLERLRMLYGDRAAGVLTEIERICGAGAPGTSLEDRTSARTLWDERTSLLITYGDQVRGGDDESPLSAQLAFLREAGMDRLLSAAHLLPFFPFTSDDGFSVSDYGRVDPRFGDWDDVSRWAESFDLMFDFVLNHCSKSHPWFEGFLRGDRPERDFFLAMDPQLDLSGVTRPRSTPLLSPFETAAGTRHVWTTFSSDQVDLNYASSELLLEMIAVKLDYVRRGARWLRLDAVGFLWKRAGTTCMHLPETHAVVQLFRDVLDAVAPGTLLVTETNVPHAENVSYFGDGNEAHLVYQFPLAPLLLDAFLTGDPQPLQEWLLQLEYPGPGRSFLNFTASHDGIGVRPLEGLVPEERAARLVQAVRDRGGLVNLRRKPDGTESPYELNITYFSAMRDPHSSSDDEHVQRFLATQAMMLGLRGIPAIYFHSLVGTPNDHAGVNATSQARSINRRKFHHDELIQQLSSPGSPQQQVFRAYRGLLEVRRAHPAFHPDAPQQVIETGAPGVVAWSRVALQEQQRLVVLANTAREPVQVDRSSLGFHGPCRDLITDRTIDDLRLHVPPGSCLWLT